MARDRIGIDCAGIGTGVGYQEGKEMTDLRKEWPDVPTEPPQPVAHWLDRSWVYNPASSHADSSDFRRRQQERMLQAQRQRAA